MTDKISVLRGHKIEYIDEEWVYSDTREPTVASWERRPCGVCDKVFTPEGHDPCLGTLPNVKNACCGHGETGEAYVQFDDESIARGEAAKSIFDLLLNDSNKSTKEIRDRVVESPHST